MVKQTASTTLHSTWDQPQWMLTFLQAVSQMSRVMRLRSLSIATVRRQSWSADRQLQTGRGAE